MPKKTLTKPYSQMTTAELREATKRFDDPGYHPPAQELTAEDRRIERMAGKLERAVKVGRPRIGLGAERVQIAMERGLRRKLDAYAKKHGVSRSKAMSEAVRKYIEAA